MSNRAKLFVGILLVLLVAGFFVIKSPSPHISLAAEPIIDLGGGVAITNTMIAAWVTTIVLALFFRAATSKMSLVPTGLQNFAEMIIEAALSFCEGIAGRENGRKFFPVVMTIFLFIITSNWLGLLPGYLTIGITHPVHPPAHGEHFQQLQIAGLTVNVIPLGGAPEAAEGDSHAQEGVLYGFLRSANTDLNMTLALALVATFFVELWGLQALGLGYLGKFFTLKGGPVGTYVGLVELISEISRIVSFTFRLFGNIFAGEVLLTVIGFLAPLVVVLPFLGLELFVGFIQAFVFALLTLVFATSAVISHDHDDHGHDEHATAHAPAHH